jgi:hypothetical protein
MSICLRAGHRYNRHSYVERKRRGIVSRKVDQCIHCGQPKPDARKTFKELMSGLDDVEMFMSRAGSTVCEHMNEPFDCPQCREARKVVNLTTS